MQPHVRLSDYEKIEHCAAELSATIPSLRSSISFLPLATAGYQFSAFVASVTEFTENLQVSKAHHHDHDVSANSSIAVETTPQCNSAMVNMTEEQYRKNLVQARRMGQSSVYKNEYGKRGRDKSPARSPARTTTPDGRRQKRSSSNDRGRGRTDARRLGFGPSSNSTQLAEGYGDCDSEEDDVAFLLDDSFVNWTGGK